MACRNHPQIEEGLDHCYRCGYRFCDECRVDFQGHPHCAACKSEAVSMLEAGPSADSSGGRSEGELPPWERRQKLGQVTAFVDTMKAVISSPTNFFRTFRVGVNTWDCLAIPVVVTTVSMIVSAITQVLFVGLFLGMAASQGAGEAELGATIGGQLLGTCCWIPLAPVLAIMGTFFGAAMIHVFLMMTSTVKEPFQQTLRGYCYAQSPGILAIIPLFGTIFGAFQALWAGVVMVKTVHRTSWGTAWMSVLWFALLFLGLMCGGAVLFAGVIGAAAGAN